MPASTPLIFRNCCLGLIVSTTLAGAACADRRGAIVGMAMNGMGEAVLPARQQRFNDSAGARHQVTLLFPPAGAYAVDGAGMAWANELAATPGIVAVVGHESSRWALQAAPIYRARGIVQIVPTATSSRLSEVSPWTFPLVASDTIQGPLLARLLKEKRKKRITLFLQDDEYGQGISKSLRKELAGSDAVVLEEVPHTSSSDFDLIVRNALSHVPAPDALVLITQGGSAAAIAQQAWKRDTSLLILGTDAVVSEASALHKLAPSAEHILLATYWLPDTTDAINRAFLKDFRASEIGGDPQWYHAAVYDAVGLLNAAITDVGNSPTDICSWLLSLGRSRPPYRGVLGNIDFTGKNPIAARLVRPNATGWELVK